MLQQNDSKTALNCQCLIYEADCTWRSRLDMINLALQKRTLVTLSSMHVIKHSKCHRSHGCDSQWCQDDRETSRSCDDSQNLSTVGCQYRKFVISYLQHTHQINSQHALHVRVAQCKCDNHSSSSSSSYYYYYNYKIKTSY